MPCFDLLKRRRHRQKPRPSPVAPTWPPEAYLHCKFCWIYEDGHCVTGEEECKDLSGEIDCITTLDSNEPCSHDLEPCIQDLEPCMHDLESCIQDLEPCMHDLESCIYDL
ncbi:hypothetical protein lerEdw1_020904 [Lerista edwardsae]|nr:hypothetical protein lerEdw1_020904 [Lerista edwardsae]